jgi:hypothetical protein
MLRTTNKEIIKCKIDGPLKNTKKFMTSPNINTFHLTFFVEGLLNKNLPSNKQG